jgi:hypothetical protein
LYSLPSCKETGGLLVDYVPYCRLTQECPFDYERISVLEERIKRCRTQRQGREGIASVSLWDDTIAETQLRVFSRGRGYKNLSSDDDSLDDFEFTAERQMVFEDRTLMSLFYGGVCEMNFWFCAPGACEPAILTF